MNVNKQTGLLSMLKLVILFIVTIVGVGGMLLATATKTYADGIAEMTGLDSDIWYTANGNNTPIFEGQPTSAHTFYLHSLNIDKYQDLMVHFKVTNNTGNTQPVESFLLLPTYFLKSFGSPNPYETTSLDFDTSRANQLTTQVTGNDGGDTFSAFYASDYNTYTNNLDITKPLGAVMLSQGGPGHYTNLANKGSLEISAPVTLVKNNFDYSNPRSIPIAMTNGSAYHMPAWLYQYRNISVVPYKSLLVADFNTTSYNDLSGADKYNGITKLFYDNSGVSTTADAIPIEETDHTKATVDSIVPTNEPGKYKVTYTYNGVTKSVTATIKSYLDAKDFTVGNGSNWTSQKFNGITSLTDNNGATVTPSDSNVTITIKDAQGHSVPSVDTNNVGSVYEVTYTNINGDSKTVKVTVGQRQIVPNNNDNESNNSSSTNTNGNSAWNPTTTTQANASTSGLPSQAAVKGSVVYATKRIYMYRNANFKKSQRLATYPKAKRINRPMFVVLGYKKSNGGALRYKVRDVNHGKKAAGKIGYVTANQKYVVNVYYQGMPKNNRITIINKKGVHAYKNVNLTKRVKTFKKGTHVTVKNLVKHNLTTRYKLSDGTYITTNKKLVIQGNY